MSQYGDVVTKNTVVGESRNLVLDCEQGCTFKGVCTACVAPVLRNILCSIKRTLASAFDSKIFLIEKSTCICFQVSAIYGLMAIFFLISLPLLCRILHN